MLDVISKSGQVACTCPLCGTELAITLAWAGLNDSLRARDLAENTVLDHLLTVHEPIIQYSPVVALGALVCASARTAHLTAGVA